MAVTINGTNTPTAGGVTYGDGSTYATTSAGTSGQVLTSAGSSAPTWSTPSTGALVFISSVTASSSATVSFTNISSTYSTYLVTFNRIVPATDGVQMRIRTSTDNGATWTSSGYRYAIMCYASDTTNFNSGSNSSTYALMTVPTMSSDANYGGLNGTLNLFNPSTVSGKQYFWNTTHIDAGAGLNLTYGSGWTTSIADVDAIQFYMSSGNIASGTFRLYGIANS
jgi:hypothetical protein